MSYEGYVQCVCDNGHYFVCDAFGQAQCQCGAAVAWDNDVDQTNCDAYGEIPYEVLSDKFLLEPAKAATCNLGHEHVIAIAVFRIPTKDESDPLRTRYDEVVGKRVPLS